MNLEAKNKFVRSRHNRSDLIDLSSDSNDSSSNNILDLFDPLSHADKEHANKSKPNEPQHNSRATLRLDISRRRNDRRLRSTSACILPAERQRDIGFIYKPETHKQHETYNSEQGGQREGSDKSSQESHSSSTTSSRAENDGPSLNLDNLTIADRNRRNSCKTKNDLEHVLVGGETESNTLKLSRKYQRSNQEVALLADKLKLVRSKFKHDDLSTNIGLVYSPTLYSSRVRDMSVKIIISSALAKAPINFTCNVTTTIEHLISHAVCSLFDDIHENDCMSNYMLKVTSKDEYFDSKCCLADYALVSHCCKFDLDVRLTLVQSKSVKRPFLRTSADDFQCKSRLCPDDLLSRSVILRYSDLNYEALSIIIETFEGEAQRLYYDVTKRSTTLQTQSLLQTTKAICALLMNCETSQLSVSKENLSELCKSYKAEGHHLSSEDRYKMIEVIQHAIKRLVDDMRHLLKLTSSSLPVDYEVIDTTGASKNNISFVDTPVQLLRADHVTVKIQLVSQLRPEWMARYKDYHLIVELKYGERSLCAGLTTARQRLENGFFPRLLFDEELQFSTTYATLPREARLSITLVGTEITRTPNSSSHLLAAEDSNQLRRSSSAASVCSTAPMYSSSPMNTNLGTSGPHKLASEEAVQVQLATAISYLFNHDLTLCCGDKFLYMRLLTDGQNEGVYMEALGDRTDPVLIIEHKRFPPEKKIYFPKQICLDDNEQITANFSELDPGVRHVLKSIIDEKHCHEPLMDDEKSLLWDHRFYLTSIPHALSKVLLSISDWSVANLPSIYKLVSMWKSLSAIDSIQLLAPSIPDEYIRARAVEQLIKLPDDELYDYLPQLVQALRFEKCVDCPLFWLLIERALKSVRIANSLYWQIKLNACDKLFLERCEILRNCLLWTNGHAFWKSMDSQTDLLDRLARVSSSIKKVRDGQRLSVLRKNLEPVQDFLAEKNPTMPWMPSLSVCDLDLGSCSYFPSNALPLKLAFRSCEESCNRQIKFYTYDAIFKMGDDLRQDMLAIQMIRLMEKLWLREGLDLRMVTFDCIATDERQGMVEMVQNAETLRKIQQNCGFLAGTFNPKAIDSYIRLWNTSELEYKTALDNFLHSCAGYSVATYILGICDRHNDNIMVTNSGHLFHIDFGKFLGDAQMIGSIKRDRTPFVLTADMAYVINGGDKPSKKFQTFIELCTMAFNVVRRHRNLFLNLFSLMSSAKINGLNNESVDYINKMMMPSLTESEAIAKFTRLIEECLSSRSTQVNFFIHNLAQLRFSHDNSKQALLSFVPKTFSMQTDGKIESLQVVHLFKTYEPEKQYYYVVRVKRQSQPDTTDIIRTFREFSELQMKLNLMFPSSQFHDINKSTSSFLMDFVGRNNTRHVAEYRRIELEAFLDKLMRLPPEISECDLIYTFFHPILRDQAISVGDASLVNETSSSFGYQEYNETQRAALYLGSNGQVKLSLSYKNLSLIIMIMHAKNLPSPEGSSGPNCYAKTYLLPDPQKQTKRKTRVVRQSCHPSFMELIVYQIPLETLKKLTLQVSVWHSEIVQYKAFLGSALIPLDGVDLSKETVHWYPLKNF